MTSLFRAIVVYPRAIVVYLRCLFIDDVKSRLRSSSSSINPRISPTSFHPDTSPVLAFFLFGCSKVSLDVPMSKDVVTSSCLVSQSWSCLPETTRRCKRLSSSRNLCLPWQQPYRESRHLLLHDLPQQSCRIYENCLREQSFSAIVNRGRITATAHTA